MKYLLLSLALSLSGSVLAQNMSIGLRGGVGYWLEKSAQDSRLNASRGSHISAETEAFIRKTTKKRWAFEAAVGTSGFSNRINSKDFFIECPVGMYDVRTYQTRNLDLSLSVQYDIMPACAKGCPLLRRVHSYAGIVVTATGSRTKTTDFYETYGTGVYTNVRTYASFWTGLNNTLTFDLNNRVQLTALSYVRIAPTQFFASFRPANPEGSDPVARAGLQLGAAYRF